MFSKIPSKIPPPEIVQQGNAAILEYFAKIAAEGSARLYEAKMLIVGDARVGKTTLLRKLQDVKAKLPPEEETTRGIDITGLKFKTTEDNDFTIHAWDFGGQEIYRATHQFFLTKRSLYILVDDSSRDDVACRLLVAKSGNTRR